MNKEIKINPDLFFPKKNKTLKRNMGSNAIKKALLETIANKDILKDLELLTLKPDKPEVKPEVKPDKPDKPEVKPKVTLNENSTLEVNNSEKHIKVDTSYGCLKNGNKPTLRQSQSKQSKTLKHYTTFGKHNTTVRILIKDKDTYKHIEKEKKQLDKHSMSDIREYLQKRKLYKVGSTAPDDVLRELYKNSYLTGDIENKNSEILIHNYLNE